MIEEDTIKLLKECDSGTKMGIDSIANMLNYVRLRTILKDSADEHEKIGDNLKSLLLSYQDDGKNPSVMAKGMSWIKTNVKLMVDDSDKTVADLTTDGCNMGVKSLSRYLNQYKAADEKSKDLAKKLIKVESDLSISMREFL